MISQKDLPEFCYPLAEVGWGEFELFVRGLVPRTDFTPSSMVEGKKCKLENIEQGTYLRITRVVQNLTVSA